MRGVSDVSEAWRRPAGMEYRNVPLEGIEPLVTHHLESRGEDEAQQPPPSLPQPMELQGGVAAHKGGRKPGGRVSSDTLEGSEGPIPLPAKVACASAADSVHHCGG